MCHKGSIKENCLLINTELADEFSSKNVNVCKDKLTYGSRKIVWWECKKCGWEWQASPMRRSQGLFTCMRCKSLGTLFPNLIEEWNDQKSIFETLPGSCKDCSWKCKVCKNVYIAKPHSRSKGNGCPYCSGKFVSDKNRLSILYSNLITEWDFSKNLLLSPSEVSYGSSKKVWWKCSKCSHEWVAKIVHRTINGTGCPECYPKKFYVKSLNKEFRSKTEILFYLKLQNDKIDFVHDGYYDVVGFGKFRYDFYIPKQNKYVEVTGYNKTDLRGARWIKYLRTIVKKRRFVKDVLRANFEFIVHRLTKDEKSYVESTL